MQTYRCYFLDGANHILRAEACECADDIGAICWAEAICRNCRPVYAAVELWCRDRMLRRCVFSQRSIAVATRDELRRKAERARARSRREPDQSRRRGLAALADQYDMLADVLEGELAPEIRRPARDSTFDDAAGGSPKPPHPAWGPHGPRSSGG